MDERDELEQLATQVRQANETLRQARAALQQLDPAQVRELAARRRALRLEMDAQRQAVVRNPRSEPL